MNPLYISIIVVSIALAAICGYLAIYYPNIFNKGMVIAGLIAAVIGILLQFQELSVSASSPTDPNADLQLFKITDNQKHGIEKADVTLILPGSLPDNQRTDDFGFAKFEIDFLDRGLEGDLEVKAEGYCPHDEQLLISAPPYSMISIQLGKDNGNCTGEEKPVEAIIIGSTPTEEEVAATPEAAATEAAATEAAATEAAATETAATETAATETAATETAATKLPQLTALNQPRLYIFSRAIAGEVLTFVDSGETVNLLAKNVDENYDWVFIERANGDSGWLEIANTRPANDFSYRNDVPTNPNYFGGLKGNGGDSTDVPPTSGGGCHILNVGLELSEIVFTISKERPNSDHYRVTIIGSTGQFVINNDFVDKSGMASGYFVPNTKFTAEGSLKNTQSTVTIKAYDAADNYLCETTTRFTRQN